MLILVLRIYFFPHQQGGRTEEDLLRRASPGNGIASLGVIPPPASLAPTPARNQCPVFNPSANPLIMADVSDSFPFSMIENGEVLD